MLKDPIGSTSNLQKGKATTNRADSDNPVLKVSDVTVKPIEKKEPSNLKHVQPQHATKKTVKINKT